MDIFSESNEAQSTKWLENKLKDRYSDHLYFTEIDVRKNVLCFKNMGNSIVKENSSWKPYLLNTLLSQVKPI